ncbi:MAG: response regulator transcription factor [Anaerolineae bacterium]|nr:response regulator transcription factor [Anaerolineae bacterium]
MVNTSNSSFPLSSAGSVGRQNNLSAHTSYRILLVEDDPDTVSLIKQIFKQADFEVVSAPNGQEGIKKLPQVSPDIVLLDLMMPDGDGWEMLERIRMTSDLPVIIMSAISQKESIVKALQMGADDYITKPIHNNEVIERVNAVLRRTIKTDNNTLVFPKEDLVIHFKSREVIYQGKFIDLTPKEFAILASLARHAPGVVTHETLRMELWGDNSALLQNRIKYLVFSLRQKFEQVNIEGKLITTVSRKGYRLKAEHE